MWFIKDHVPKTQIKNLIKARSSARYRPPRSWRCAEESQLIRQFAALWFTCTDRNRPSSRSWARGLGIDHMWLVRLTKQFMKDPGEPNRLLAGGLPQPDQLRRAQEVSLQMRERGELRPLRMRRA